MSRWKKQSSASFLRDLEPALHNEDVPQGLSGRLDDETRARLERLRRGER